MDQAFKQMMKTGHNNIDDIVKWLKQANVINNSQDEKNLRALFEGEDVKNIAMDRFKHEILKFAEQKGLSLDELSEKLLGGDAANFLDSVGGAFNLGDDGGDDDHSGEEAHHSDSD